ncbi:MAG: hypothetical protein WBY47_15500, partial [Desulfobacterales bacterium]
HFRHFQLVQIYVNQSLPGDNSRPASLGLDIYNRTNGVDCRRRLRTKPCGSCPKWGTRPHTPGNPFDGHTLYRGFLKDTRFQNQTGIGYASEMNI